MPRDFHVISRVFVETLEKLGFAVTTANEDYPENVLGKLLSKLDTELARWLTRRAIRRQFLDGKRWNLILIVKGRGVGPELAADMKRHADRVVGYHFDALAYDKATARWGSAVDRVSTFDYRDADARGWPVIELFATRPGPSPTPPIRHRASAIMRNHSDRLAFIDQVFRTIGTDNTYVYIFEKGRLTFLINFLRDPALYWRWRRYIHFKPLDYATYSTVLAGSDFTLDYAHPLQTGATLRSFEALANRVKLITNNPWPSRHSKHFGPHNTVVWRADVSPNELCREVERLSGVRPPGFQRTPERFMAEVLGLEEEPRQAIDSQAAARDTASPSQAGSPPRNVG